MTNHTDHPNPPPKHVISRFYIGKCEKLHFFPPELQPHVSGKLLTVLNLISVLFYSYNNSCRFYPIIVVCTISPGQLNCVILLTEKRQITSNVSWFYKVFHFIVLHNLNWLQITLPPNFQSRAIGSSKRT